MKTTNGITTIPTAALDFMLAECLQIHALCDRANVPRAHDGFPYSMAQRVAILEGVASALCQQIGKPHATQH